MNVQELKEAYYQLALAELELMFNNNSKGRKFNKLPWQELAKLICLDDVSLYQACKIVHIGQSEIYKRSLRFVGTRVSAGTSNQGNRLRKSYTLEQKLSILTDIDKGKGYNQVSRDTDIPYCTLSKWMLQRQAGKLVK